MCTVLLTRETLHAEKRSASETQELVDKLILQEKELKDNPKSGYGAMGSYMNDIYVWFDCACFGNGKNGFYYLRNHPLRAHGSTAYDFPAEIIQKSKLKQYQIDFMERKCRETDDEDIQAKKQKEENIEKMFNHVK